MNGYVAKVDKNVMAAWKSIVKGLSDHRRGLSHVWAEKSGLMGTDGNVIVRWRNGIDLEEGFRFDPSNLPAGDAVIAATREKDGNLLYMATAEVKGGVHECNPDQIDPPHGLDACPHLDEETCPDGYLEIGLNVQVLQKALRAFQGYKGPQGPIMRLRVHKDGGHNGPIYLYEKHEAITVTAAVMPCRITD